MGKHFWLILANVLLAALKPYASAQSIDSLNIGTVSGQVKDSVNNHILVSATVAVYAGDSEELLKFQLSNNFGRFAFSHLPIGSPLRIVVSHMGYRPANVAFEITPERNSIELDPVIMDPSAIALQEVLVAPPPMQMRGDTLEFNAAAFKLDSNAVVEDLLHQLPGLTIWNDGLITVNGKRIQKLFVNGKEFFGGASNIALQNLPKDVVKKIQVYEDKKGTNQIEPPVNMNVVLKQSKDQGLFGKVGYGTGTERRKDLNGVINYFGPRSQISAVVAKNDINKAANSVSSLIEFNSFKGEDIAHSYHSDFSRAGVTDSGAGGLRLLYDFKNMRNGSLIKNYVEGNLFFRKSESELVHQNDSFINLGSTDQVHQLGTHKQSDRNFMQDINLKYFFSSDYQDLTATVFHRDMKTSLVSEESQRSLNTSDTLLATSSIQQLTNGTENVYGGSIIYVARRRPGYVDRRRRSIDMEIQYHIENSTLTNKSGRIAQLMPVIGADRNYFNRQYNSHRSITSQTFSSGFEDILDRVFPLLDIGVRNVIVAGRTNRRSDVTDLMANHADYQPNLGLSASNQENTINYQPSVNISKSVVSQLDNRYRKDLKIGIIAQAQLYFQSNDAEKDFQNIERRYTRLLPSIYFKYSNFQVEGSRKSYSLDYKTFVIYPTVDQLVPLLDSSNLYDWSLGNNLLRPSLQRDFSANFYYDSGDLIRPMLINNSITLGSISDFIADSAYFDAIGRQIHYPINSSRNKYISYKGFAKKMYKIKDSELEISANLSITFSKFPSVINQISYNNRATSQIVSSEIGYLFRGLFSVRTRQSLHGGVNSQAAVGKIRYSNWASHFHVSFLRKNGVFVATSVDINSSHSSYINSAKYTIWNLEIGYRFLKASNAEIKLSALDLLNQNSRITNQLTSNIVTRSSDSVLRQYFLMTVSYYPRKFGLGVKPK